MSQTQNPATDRHPLYFESQIEVRNVQGDTGIRIFGYSALFNVRSHVMRTSTGKRFVEEILPGAFDGVNDRNCDCQYDHRLFLAGNGNYRRGVDARGRWFEYDHDPSDPDHVSVLAKIRRGEVRGASFMFDEPDILDQDIIKDGDLLVRRIKKFRMMWDEGPVRKPAYPATTVSIRSIDEYQETDLEVPAGAGGDAEQRDMSGAYHANTNPTDAQKAAGNYKKGKVRIHGMDISIENPIGSTRSGVDANGTPWENEMKAHYGYILGSKAGDGDNLDVFLTDDAESARVVYVVDQINPDGSFDEHKCIIGPNRIDQAEQLYRSHYPPDWAGMGSICCVPMACFLAWAMDGKTKREPLFYGGTNGMLYGTYVEAAGTVLESGGTVVEPGRIIMEEQRNMGGNPVEVGGNPAEAGGNPAEQQRNAAEFTAIEKRKLQVRATLIS